MTNLIKRTFWIFSIVFLGALTTEAQRISTHKKTTGKVLFTAFSPRGFSLLAVKEFLIEGKNLKQEVKLNIKNNELFALVELPEGIYRITTKRTFGEYKFIRSAFQVRSGVETLINIFPPFRVSLILTHIDENGFRDEYTYDKEPKYQTFRVPQNKNGNLKLVVRYDQKKQVGKIITFTGENVMASYDAFSIYANELSINTETLEIETLGDVTLENGLKREKVKSAKVFIESGKLKLQANTNPI